MVTVSAILPVFNGARTVCRAADSVLAQGGVALELLIVDDGSTDDTLTLVRALYGDDARVRILPSATNGGVSAARNIGLDAARGEWIALIDADDMWRPDRLTALLRRADGADLVADAVLTWDAVAERETGPLFTPVEAARVSLVAALRERIEGSHVGIGLLKPLMRSGFLRGHGLRYDPDVRHGEDLLLYVACLMAGAAFVLIEQGFYLYSTPYGRVSRRKSPDTKSGRDGPRIARALEAMRRRAGATLSPEDADAFAFRIAALDAAGDWWKVEELVHARRYGAALRTGLASRAVRARVWKGLKSKTLGSRDR